MIVFSLGVVVGIFIGVLAIGVRLLIGAEHGNVSVLFRKQKGDWVDYRLLGKPSLMFSEIALIRRHEKPGSVKYID